MQETLQLVKEAQNVVKSRFLLCILVAQRIHQIEKGAQPTIDVDPAEYASPKKFFELALREINDGNMDLEQVSEED
ncbi:MAG: DNA-directed RNA polymerase subunit omega [Candidatus Nitrohelix vancouverensis]|uniref:DNA-directed RNA polymerase subunit omega n=1 Tax=Candidatus Nitrohelix vancouverensis TaxID=2705534 RepID=A0A7T0C582_9BACT|nr:MAG: DNA-directed RNA polymerase subunit omega [Candidatus Nitrohelix vancouverensis]